MADQNNSGQFGNRNDTEQQAQKGGEASTGSFGEKNSADPSQAGRQGGEDRRGGEGGFELRHGFPFPAQPATMRLCRRPIASSEDRIAPSIQAGM